MSLKVEAKDVFQNIMPIITMIDHMYVIDGDPSICMLHYQADLNHIELNAPESNRACLVQREF